MQISFFHLATTHLRSHTLMYTSESVKRSLISGAYLTYPTLFGWPISVEISWPVDKSQTLATRSLPPVNILSSVTSTLNTALACPSATWRHVIVGIPDDEFDI